MKKIAIGIGIIIGLLAIAKMLGLVVNYTLPTTSMEPSLKLNSHIISTSLMGHDVGDYIAFRPPLDLDKAQTYVKRLCATAGDIIEMRNGVFYRNDENFDKALVLQHAFVVDEYTYKRINKKYPITDYNAANNDYHVMITDAVATEFQVMDRKLLEINLSSGGPILAGFDDSHSWTRDNFGPLTVPEGKAFAMGDNRHYSYDCRYFGFIEEDDITGVVIGK
ncbi:MAG: signal peptidase I [Bacteroidia bacterium]|jgi:signal peptidase I